MKRLLVALLVLILASPALACWMIPTSAFGGDWNYKSRIDELDDRLASEAWILNRPSSFIDPVQILQVSCAVPNEKDFRGNRPTEPEIRVAVSFGEYLGFGGSDLVYRFDSEAPVDDQWHVSAKGTGIVATPALGAWSFAQRLMTANQVIIRARDVTGVSHTAKFSLAGSKGPIGRVLKDCTKGAPPKADEPEAKSGYNARMREEMQRAVEGATQGATSGTRKNDEPKPNPVASILRNVERMKQPAPPQEEKPAAETPGPVSRQVSAFEQNDMVRAIQQQLFSCWRLDPGAERAEDMVVEIHIALNQDGSLQRADVVDVARMAQDGYFRSAAENARRAIYKCSPFRLPPNKYSIWRELTLRFNPREMFGT